MRNFIPILLTCFPIIVFGQCVSGDCENGYGAFTYPSGSKYVGEFKDGKKNGQGTYTYTSADIYVGEWKDDKRDGQGTYSWANGNKYVGEWNATSFGFTRIQLGEFGPSPAQVKINGLLWLHVSNVRKISYACIVFSRTQAHRGESAIRGGPCGRPLGASGHRRAGPWRHCV